MESSVAGNPKAHFTFNLLTSAALSPACEAGQKARVQQVLTPAVPLRTCRRIAEHQRCHSTHGRGRRRGIERMFQGFAGDEFRDGTAAEADCRFAIEIIGPDSMAASTRSADMA